MIARIIEQLTIGSLLAFYYSQNRSIVLNITASVFCFVYAALDVTAGLFCGYCSKDPRALFALYVVQYFAIITYTVLGGLYLASNYIWSIVLWS